jgi:D-glycero-D-manno-heptose 1,7-bisphosphate phosphatase
VKPAVFVDRDGTIVVERYYLADPDDVELVPGAVRALAELAAAGYALVVVTNQSGIARGLYDDAAFHAVQRRVEELLAAEGVHLDAVFYCPHHPDFTGPCDCRKPGTALFRRAAAELGLDLARSFFVGDRLKDVVPAFELGGRAVLVRTGYGAEHEAAAGPDVVVVDDLAAAAALVLRQPDGASRRGQEQG